MAIGQALDNRSRERSLHNGRIVQPGQIELLHGHINPELHPDLKGRNDVLMLGVADPFGNIQWRCGYHWVRSVQKLPPSLMPAGCDNALRGTGDFK